MVEIRLESIEDGSIPKDCYVSVRVGETQKLSRLAAARVYRFPQASDQRYGKVEIFRRIGACSIDVDPNNQGMREVKISCGDADFGTLGLKFAVESEEAAKKAAPAVEDPSKDDASKKVSSKVKAAKDYLSKHGLEVRLSEAMQAVLRERPDDPAEYLARMLLSSSVTSSGGIKLPPVARAQPQPPTASMPEGRKFEGMPELPPTTGKMQAAARPLKLEPLAKAPTQELKAPGVAVPRPASLTPFRAYYLNYFRLARPEDSTRLYAKFPTKRPAAKVATKPKAAPLTSFGAYYRENFDGDSSDALARLYNKFPAYQAVAPKARVAPLTQFSAYYRQNFDDAQTSAISRLYSKFPAHVEASKKAAAAQVRASAQLKPGAGFALKPSVGTWLMRPVHRKAVKAPERPFAKLPSVGTWLIPRLEEPEVAFKAAAPATALATASSGPAWSLKPSIGTWLMRPPKAMRAALAPAPSTQPASSGSRADWALKPSIGSWLMAKPVALKRQAPKEKPFNLKPSVGTWLNSVPQDVLDLAEIKRQAAKALIEGAVKKPLLLSTSMMLGPNMASLGLRPMIRIL